MHVSRIDLNLFTVFDAIYREGGITPASKRLHLSQSAVSHALARLREVLDDPLFERRGNEMIPTPRARTLATTIGSSLGSLEQMLQRTGHFDPSTSERSFAVAAREAQESSFLPALLDRLRVEAPQVDVSAVRIERRDLEDDLQSGEVDVAIDVALPLSAEVRRERLRGDDLIVVARAAHPLVQGAITLETYLAMEHVLVTGRRRGGGYEDLQLGRHGWSRRIRMRCQQHATANDVVSRSDWIVTMLRGYAGLVRDSSDNQILPFPLEIPPLESFLYWHANVDEDPASRWFRQLMLDVLSARPATSASAMTR